MRFSKVSLSSESQPSSLLMRGCHGFVGRAVVPRPHRLCVRFLTMMFCGWTKCSLHRTFRCLRILGIIRIEHCDHRYGATGIVFSPLAFDKRELHGSPVIALALNRALL